MKTNQLLKLVAMIPLLFFSKTILAQWSLTGNPLTTSQFLGSTNNIDIVVKRNFVQSGLLDSASGNTSWGVGSLNAASPNNNNTAIGFKILPINTSGGDNTAIGNMALFSNTGGNWNSVNGMQALYTNSTGNSNVSNGYQSLYFNTIGTGNVANGYKALDSNTTGNQNTANGYSALFSNKTGSYNVADGYSSLFSNSTGSYNSALGVGANVGATNLSYATAIGAGSVAGRSNTLALGGTGIYTVSVGVGVASPNSSAILDLTTDSLGLLPPRIALTSTASASPLAANVPGMILYNTATAGSGSTAVTPGYYYNNGTAWVRFSDATSGGWNLIGNAGTTPGIGAGKNFIGTTDNKDVVFAVNNVQSGLLDNTYNNTSWGYQALNPATTAGANEAFGYQSLQYNTTGNANEAFGYQALDSNTTGYENAAFGNYTLLNNTTGQLNVALGGGALQYNKSGSQNIAVGVNALSSTTGSFNVGVGDNANANNTTGTENTAVGQGAGVGSGNLTNATAIGSQTAVNASNTMNFGAGNVVGWGFGNPTIPSGDAIIVGTSGSANGNGAYLTTGGAWTNGSDKNIKEDFSNLDNKDVLSRINQLPVTRWKYKGTSEYHIGPMAQDFYKAFNVGNDDKHISTIDPASIALIGIKALSVKNDSLQNTNAQQQEEIQQIQQVNNNLQQQLNDLKTTISQMQTAMSQCCNSYSSNIAKEASRPLLATGTDVPALQQNTPNPYTGSTVIGYHLPQSTTNAEIIISDLTGNVLKSISLNGNGDGQITFNAGTLAAGSYFYTLLVNGQKIDTKQMIVN